jgi:hypothetical protein
MTPQARVLRALHGGHADKVPFTMYESKIPQCVAEREMRNRGLCIVYRTGVFKTLRPNVKMTQEVYWEGERKFTRTYYETPVGTLTTLDEAAGFTSWHHEKMFKSPDDYEALRFLIEDEQYESNYASFARAAEAFGEDAIFRAAFGLEPMQALISGRYMAMQDYCLQWMDNRDEILALYEALVEKRRQVYELVAKSPATHANYGGNVVPQIIGLDGFRQYYVPHYNEAAEVMHKYGKLIGSHFDADCGLLAEAIAETDLDYIEAFTPAPDTDMTLAEARAAWPDKVLWINYPSSVHLAPDAEVARVARDLVEQNGSADGLLVGITEDIPADRWQDSCRAIMDGLEQHVRLRPAWYA